MKISIRVDSSLEMGSGHLMRCLTLADALRENGAEVSFVCRELPGNFSAYLEEKGFEVQRLPYDKSLSGDIEKSLKHSAWLGADWETDALQTVEILTGEQADWLIVDHYAIDYRWEVKLRLYTKKIMVIDDIADRQHDCDLLLDQNLYEDMESRYDGLVSEDCQKMLGPKYALLRREFVEARKNLKMRDGTVKRILIFFGGSDPTNETEKALEAVHMINRPDIAVDVVVGSANPHKEKIEGLCSKLQNAHFHCQVDNMAELMVKADLAIGAGGSTTWERCFLGLPAITLTIAENQVETTSAVEATGAAWNLGENSEVDPESILMALKKAIDNPYQLRKMSNIGTALMGNPVDEDKDIITAILVEEPGATV